MYSNKVVLSKTIFIQIYCFTVDTVILFKNTYNTNSVFKKYQNIHVTWEKKIFVKKTVFHLYEGLYRKAKGNDSCLVSKLHSHQ